ncbi:MAG TPA: 4-(cytidine 5'-diphospho)-2-C-methyl-D-erythritol kinase [Vicinamibacteria bacterium]|jgi:4-diphosphocytidyl-2-C-methyl-D-erythritol kinase
MRRALRVRAFAKVNLGLEVLGLRTDGYHELRTLFQTIGLHDDVVLRDRKGRNVVLCDHPGVPLDGRNLALRAADELARFAGVRQGVEITLTKRIPVGGGLGGGSSDAAAVLLALDRAWGLGLGPEGLHPLARRLGADVPFFLVGGTALGLGRGDEIYPLHEQVNAHVVVVDLARPVSTAAVFRRVDQSLTPRENSYTIFRFISRNLAGASGYRFLANDLEEAAFAEAPELRAVAVRIRSSLERGGCSLAALSGSGSSFFGLFGDAGKARRAQGRLEALGFRSLACRTLSLDAYRRTWSRSLGGGWGGRR